MLKSDRPILMLAGLNGLMAVAFGAFAAHGLSDPQAKEWLRTGALYALTHAAAALAVTGRSRAAGLLFGLGALVFAGTLYAMGLGAPRWLGAVTPAGGLTLIAGWAVLLVTGLRARDQAGGQSS